MENSLEFDLGWGNPYFLLDILKNIYNRIDGIPDFGDMSYAPDQGISELIEMTKVVIKKTTGLEYKHILITNGATGGINCCLRYFKKKYDINTILTQKYGYPFYEEMISKAGFVRNKRSFNNIHQLFLTSSNISCIRLIDSPSNPQGNQTSNGNELDTIWDAVYHNRIYNACPIIIPKHRVMVGSYSKLLGITGARIGFVATNNDLDFQNLIRENLMENATISVPGQKLVVNILKNVNLDDFMNFGKKSLDYNREEVSRVEYLFDNQPIQKVGMFYSANVDKKALQILNKCGIKYVALDEDFIRLSLGQTNEITRNAVKTILKQDKIRGKLK